MCRNLPQPTKLFSIESQSQIFYSCLWCFQTQIKDCKKDLGIFMFANSNEYKRDLNAIELFEFLGFFSMLKLSLLVYGAYFQHLSANIPFTYFGHE